MPQVMVNLPYGPESAEAVGQLTAFVAELGGEAQVVSDPATEVAPEAALVEEGPPIPEEEAGAVMQEQGARGLRPPMEGDSPAPRKPSPKKKAPASSADREGRRPPPKR